MSKKEKEFTRRIGKMHKHVDALQDLAKTVPQEEALDTIREKLNALEDIGFEPMASESPILGQEARTALRDAS